MRIKCDAKVTYYSTPYYHMNIYILGEFKSFINNKLDGEYKSYWSSGNPALICHYKNGKLNGEYIAYRTDGSMFQHVLYDNGKIIKELI